MTATRLAELLAGRAPRFGEVVSALPGVRMLAVPYLRSNTTPEFRSYLAGLALELGLSPDWLATVMSFESGFKPNALNKASGASGLIQFMDFVLKPWGLSGAEIRTWSGIDQLHLVRRYFAPYRGRLKDLDDTYLAVFYPAAIGKPDDWVVARKDAPTTREQKVYAQNAGFDKAKTGQITRADIVRTIRDQAAAAKGERVEVDPLPLPGAPSRGPGAPSSSGGAGIALAAVAALGLGGAFLLRK